MTDQTSDVVRRRTGPLTYYVIMFVIFCSLFSLSNNIIETSLYLLGINPTPQTTLIV